MCTKLFIINGELSDYVNSNDNTRSQQKLLISQTPPPVTFNEVLIENNQTTNNPVETTTNNIVNTTNNYNSPQISQVNNFNYINKNNNVNEAISNKEQSTTPIAINQNPQMARIQRDMNSPSATLRVRALRALKNPTNAAYSNFDVPHEEQDIISLEERQPPPPPSIEELMRDVIVYVEVRTGEDNRSEGVKKVISQLGARVNDKLLRGTTHVIFKDGLLSTYKKAKNWNIPVVSILWVEACKNRRMICDPKEYPISNIDRYENPELYEKMKRHKSMQPDSECNKRIRLKQGTTATKDSTPKTVAETLTKTQTAVNNNTPKSSKRQTDISQFFRKLATPITTDDNNALPGSTTAITLSQDIPESPATQLLNRIENNTFTPLQPRRTASETNSTTRSIAISIKSSNSGVASQQTVISAGSKKSLQFPTPTKRTSPRKKIIPLITPKKRILQRRTSVQQMPVAPSTSTPSLQTTESLTSAGPMTRRRSSLHSTINMSLSTFAPNTTDALLTPQAKQKQFSAIPEENNEGKIAAANITSQRRNSRSPRSPRGSPKSPKVVGGGAVAKRRIIRRRTTYTQKTPDMSPPEKSPEKPKAAKTPNKRRTLYTPRLMEDNASSELSLKKINAQPKVLDENLLQFALTPTTTLIGSSQESITDVPPIIAAGGRKANIEPGALIEEHSSAMVFNSTRLPSANRRRTLFDVSMDIIQQRLHNINNSARRSVVAKDFTTTASNDIQSPSILPPTTATNSLLSATKRTNVVEVDAPTTPATTTTTTNGTNSPPKTIKKRKLFVPNDTSLILTATPPTTSSAKKANTADATSAKRRRTITPRVLTNSRKSIATTNTKSEVIIKPPQAAPPLIANLTKNAVQSVPMLANNNAMQLAVTRKEGGGFAGKGGETSLTQLKLTATKISSKIELSCPTLNAKCITTFDTIEKLSTPTAGAGAGAGAGGGGGLAANELKKVVTTTTMLPQVKGSFVSIISSKASDTTIKQQLILQQKHNIMEVDENVAINSPHTETNVNLNAQTAQSATADYMQSTTTTAITTTSATTHTGAATISQQLVTTTSQPKVVKKSQMSAIPDTIKDAVVVGAAGSCTQLQRNTENGGKKKWPYIVCTNMHREQIKVMREAIATLGGLQLSHFVNDQTTHVISFEPRRTLNLLRALIRGLWILDYKWVLDSLKAGQWLNEEEYELRTFSRAVEICRTERQAFGKTYKCELFSDLGTFYISSRCGPISKDNLKELIELCGGKVVDQRKRAKYILGDPHKTLEDKIYVTPFWVLDSITQMQVMRQQKYAYAAPTSLPTKTQQTQLPQSNMIDVVSLN